MGKFLHTTASLIVFLIVVSISEISPVPFGEKETFNNGESDILLTDNTILKNIENIQKFKTCSIIFCIQNISTTPNQILSNEVSRTSMVFNNEFLSNVKLPFSIPKFHKQCSLAVYLYISPTFQDYATELSETWLKNLPGGFRQSYHIIFFKQKEWTKVLQNVPLPLHLRLMTNSLFIVLNKSSSSLQMFQSDIWGKKITLLEPDLIKNSTTEKQLFPNKANFNHAPLIWAYVANPIITQEKLDIYRKFRKPIHLILTPMVQISESLNATPLLRKINSLNYGVFDKVTQSWTGIIGEVLSGNAHVTQAVLLTKERNDILSLSKIIDQDGLAFVTGSPKSAAGSVTFLFRSYEFTVWIVQISIIGAISILLLVSNDLSPLNAGRLFKTISYIVKPAFEQAEDSLEYNDLITKFTPRVLIGPWLLSTILLSMVFKTNMMSTLTSPTIQYRPQDFVTLARSTEYKIKFHGMKETIAGVFFSTLKEKGNTIVTLLDKRIVEYYEGEDDINCVTDTQDGDFVCLGVRNIINLAALQSLTQENGEPLFRISKDNLVSAPFVFGVSKELPHIMDRLNMMMNHFAESGVYQYFMDKFIRDMQTLGKHHAKQRRKAGKWFSEEKSTPKGKAHRFAVFNALFTLALGFVFGTFGFVLELIIYRIKRIRSSWCQIGSTSIDVE